MTPQALHADLPPVVIFVDSSQDFARAHVPGANWMPRGWLEFHVGALAPSHDTPIAVTCGDGRQATLAGATLTDLGYQAVTVLEGGMAAWQHAALPVERGLSGVMNAPTDVVLSGPDRNFADMMHYLRWEEALGRSTVPELDFVQSEVASSVPSPSGRRLGCDVTHLAHVGRISAA